MDFHSRNLEDSALHLVKTGKFSNLVVVSSFCYWASMQANGIGYCFSSNEQLIKGIMSEHPPHGATSAMVLNQLTGYNCFHTSVGKNIVDVRAQREEMYQFIAEEVPFLRALPQSGGPFLNVKVKNNQEWSVDGSVWDADQEFNRCLKDRKKFRKETPPKFMRYIMDCAHARAPGDPEVTVSTKLRLHRISILTERENDKLKTALRIVTAEMKASIAKAREATRADGITRTSSYGRGGSFGGRSGIGLSGPGTLPESSPRESHTKKAAALTRTLLEGLRPADKNDDGEDEYDRFEARKKRRERHNDDSMNSPPPVHRQARPARPYSSFDKDNAVEMPLVPEVNPKRISGDYPSVNKKYATETPKEIASEDDFGLKARNWDAPNDYDHISQRQEHDKQKREQKEQRRVAKSSSAAAKPAAKSPPKDNEKAKKLGEAFRKHQQEKEQQERKQKEREERQKIKSPRVSATSQPYTVPAYSTPVRGGGYASSGTPSREVTYEKIDANLQQMMADDQGKGWKEIVWGKVLQNVEHTLTKYQKSRYTTQFSIAGALDYLESLPHITKAISPSNLLDYLFSLVDSTESYLGVELSRKHSSRKNFNLESHDVRQEDVTVDIYWVKDREDTTIAKLKAAKPSPIGYTPVPRHLGGRGGRGGMWVPNGREAFSNAPNSVSADCVGTEWARTVVVDVPNIALHAGNKFNTANGIDFTKNHPKKRFHVAGLELVREYFVSRGHSVVFAIPKCMTDDHAFDVYQKQKWGCEKQEKKIQKWIGYISEGAEIGGTDLEAELAECVRGYNSGIPYFPDDFDALQDMRRANPKEWMEAPTGGAEHDDNYILEVAISNDFCILSGDKLKKHFSKKKTSTSKWKK